MAESFFATLDCDLIDHTRFRTRDDANLAVIDYIEGFYNTRLRHSALDYQSPIKYEQSHRPSAADPNVNCPPNRVNSRC